MGDIIVTKSDKTPTKKVVEVLSNVSAKKIVCWSEDPDTLFQEVKMKARILGADAVIKASVSPFRIGSVCFSYWRGS